MLLPAEGLLIKPDLSDAFPDLLGSSETSVRVLGIEHTFWEKATIMHTLCYQDSAKQLTDRMSRHHYDMAFLIDHPAKECALDDLALLEQVAHYKPVFFKAV